MPDEEGSSLKVKSPPWRSEALTAFIKDLDRRVKQKGEHETKEVLRKKGIYADLPMKRLPSKKLNTICIEIGNDVMIKAFLRYKCNSWPQFVSYPSKR